MKIIHMGIMKNIEEMGDITRHIYSMCEGEHSYKYIYDWYKQENREKACYVLHHFKNKIALPAFEDFDPPCGSTIISLLHSSAPCSPNKNANAIVTISEAQYSLYSDIDTACLIRGATNIEPYLKEVPKYDNPVFGRISRWEPGKFHPYWNGMVKATLSKNDDSTYMMIMNNPPDDFVIKHDRAFYVQGIMISDIELKAKALNAMNIYADAHGDFIDTFNVSLLESMASGLAPIILRGEQEAMVELIGAAGIVVDSDSQFLTALDNIVKSRYLKEELGGLARERAKEYSLKRMIEEWNDLLKKRALLY